MYITVSRYRAKAGQEDAIIALHEGWQRQHQPKTKGYLSGELLRNAENSREFLAIMRFESQEAAEALAHDPQQDVWSRRIVSLTEYPPVLTEYSSEWQSH